LAAQIVRQAKIRTQNEPFVVVFCAMGVKYDVARFFLDGFERSGVLANVAVYLSLADAPSIERLVAPRCALTAAEYLAYDRGMHVLVVMTDMTNYCEALREVSSIRGEVPSRKGYPGYLYSDLSSLYERAGKIMGSNGSITQIPVLTMPNDDISHPIPDLSGYITEGQIVLDRELSQRGVYPPVAGLPSLSRLMKDGIGPGMTREDHKDVASQLFAAYSRVKAVRNLSSIIGEEELSATDKRYLSFGDKFEREYLTQAETDDRTIERTLDLGWKVLSVLPRDELLRVKREFIAKYLDAASADERDLDDEEPDDARFRTAPHGRAAGMGGGAE
jgi:V/A-type H+-transporting ATPase subunit B